MSKKLIFILLLISMKSSFSKAIYSNVLTTNFGMANVSVTENESNIQQTDTSVQQEEDDELASSAVSAISFQMTYEFLHNGSMGYFVKATAPLLSASSTGVFGGGFGFNKYLNDLSSKYTYDLNGNKVTLVPTTRYYWGASGGIGYLVYNTESAIKSDIFFDLAFHGGLSMSMGDDWGLRGEVAASRTTGVTTTGIKIEAFFGAMYYL